MANSPDYGSAAVGSKVKTPWAGEQEWGITQGWGPTSYTGEPAGHGSPHWHAGVDLGIPSNTIVSFPQINPGVLQNILSGLALNLPNVAVAYGVSGVFHRGTWNGKAYVADPGGYGSHVATVTIQVGLAGVAGPEDQLFDVVLGHGSGWLQADGAVVRGGDALIKTDNEGNSSGPHLHFEVRPVKGSYGSDVDPWDVLSQGAGAIPGQVGSQVGSDVQAAAGAIATAITKAEQDAVNLALGLGLAGLGVAALGAGVVLLWKGFAPAAALSPSRPRRAAPAVPAPHPAARVARATRAAPAAPQIPVTPAQARPAGAIRPAA